MKNNDIIVAEQGGLLPSLGTNDTIGKFLGDIYNYINRESKKAFNTIDHSILISKLKLIDLNKSVISLLINYLSYRQQSMRINGVSSDLSNILCGVPQGSTLGSLLFEMYINDATVIIF